MIFVIVALSVIIEASTPASLFNLISIIVAVILVIFVVISMSVAAIFLFFPL